MGAQAELFPSPQGDLFGGPEPERREVYVVPYRIAVNTLQKTLAALVEATEWPWDPDMKASLIERNVPKMLAALPDEEAADWRGRFDAEIERLDVAA